MVECTCTHGRRLAFLCIHHCKRGRPAFICIPFCCCMRHSNQSFKELQHLLAAAKGSVQQLKEQLQATTSSNGALEEAAQKLCDELDAEQEARAREGQKWEERERGLQLAAEAAEREHEGAVRSVKAQHAAELDQVPIGLCVGCVGVCVCMFMFVCLGMRVRALLCVAASRNGACAVDSTSRSTAPSH